MSTALIESPQQKGAVITNYNSNLQVSAETPQEMVQANQSLIDWCTNKISLLRAEHKELQEAYEHAKANKWRTTTLKKHAVLASKRVEFFEKMKGALEQGYYIVPNFPITMFAIRTNKAKPLSMWTLSTQSYKPGLAKYQFPDELPAGEGEYKNPFPLVSEWQSGHNDKGTPEWESHAVDWKKIDFPLSMAKPHIMQATTRAMALKIFDEIGILQESRSGDPIIIGRLVDPRKTYSKLFRKHISFIIGWHLDTATL